MLFRNEYGCLELNRVGLNGTVLATGKAALEASRLLNFPVLES